ncbi:MAG: hypothetical protein JO199_07120 [Candidatus Eremiobacteraeota bacterium]|nr:hypothetical protein [Candidatus Eremiobacteraeota bacterium]
MKPDNPTTKATRRYLTGLTLAITAYVVVLFAAYTAVERWQPAGPVRYLLLLAPLIPVAFLIPLVVRFLRETDEFERRIVTESLAIAGGVTAILAVTYGFLENTGLPHLSAWWTWVVLMGSWLVARIFVARSYQ